MKKQPRQVVRPFSRHTMLGVCTILLLTLITACGSPAPAADTAASAAPAGDASPAASTGTSGNTASGSPTTINWIIWADDIANDKNLNAEVKLFNDSHPDVQVKLIGATWNDYTPKIQAMTAAGTPPDVISIQSEADFVSKGFMLPLDDLIKQDSLDTNRFFPGALTPAYDGKIYGLRHDNAYWMLYYNKDLFDVAGIAYPPAEGYTIDQFMETACKLSKADQGQWGMHNLHWLNGILAQQQGMPYLEMVDGVPQYRIDDPKTLAFYQKVADFINKQNCQPTADQSTSLGGADPFLAGKAAMSFNGNWGFGNVKENAKFNWDVAPIPGVKQPNVGMKIGIAANSQNQAAAWTFLKWLTYEPEATRFRSEHGMGQPAINDQQAVDTFLNGPVSPAGLPKVFEALSKPENTLTVLDVPGSSEANNIINPVSDEVMNGQSQAADVIPQAVPQANEILAENWKKANGQ
ncbi:MAG TPA: sugar ABC transporter substrate-binding protein [Herpetosiphonaceae bacterium]